MEEHKANVSDLEKTASDNLLGTTVQAHNILDKLALKFNAELRGVERVPEEEREQDSIFTPFFIYCTPNLAISALSTGALGPTLFGLDFWTSTIVIVLFVFLGAIPVGFFATFGSRFGLRQQIISRYLAGNIMGRIFAFFTVITCIGWNAINIIPCVELLCELGPLPPWVGCIIFAVATCLMAMMGNKYIHVFERYLAIPNIIIFFIIIARLTMSHKFTFGTMGKGTVEAGNVLTFIATIFGFIAGWVPSAADFMVYIPSETPKWRVFWPMVFGLFLPATFTLILGAACASAAVHDPEWLAAWDNSSIGGLVYQILVVNSLHRFGKFCCVIFALSGIANNLPGSYLLALAIQAIWNPLAKFPRIGWCIVGNALTLALAIPAYYDFAATMADFLSIIGYNVTIYIGIGLSEHFIFRKGFGGYDIRDFEDRSTFPVGWAAIFAFCCGIGTTIIGMNQTWYLGVVSQKFGPYGGELATEMNIILAFVAYTPARYYEKKYYNR